MAAKGESGAPPRKDSAGGGGPPSTPKRSLADGGKTTAKDLSGGDGLIKESFGTKALGLLRNHDEVYDLVLVSDIGYTQDDEKALAMVVALQRLGVIANFYVVANTSNAVDRARLAKGTLRCFNAGDIPVAVGSPATQPSNPAGLHFEACQYMADSSELYNKGKEQQGVELIFEAIEKARKAGRKLSIACTSALTDMAEAIADPRWKSRAPGVVCAITVMCGACEDANGIYLDRTAQNARFDLDSAEYVYAQLQAQRAIRFTVVTRHSAAACRLPRNALNGSLHPVAKRLATVAKPGLLALWKRANLSPDQRKAAGDSLPPSRDVAWFRSTFLNAEAPEGLGPDDDVWDFFVGFNEYDGLTAVVAAVIPSTNLFPKFFQPYQCPHTATLVLGVAQGQPGVDDPALACELLHDLMVIALGGGAGDWAQRISDNQQKNKVDLLMFGDFGKDQDDEKALAMAVTLQYAKVIDRMTVVTNLGDSRMRARLAKGTLNVLEARNVAVAVGSDGGRPGEEIHEYEFAGCNYLAAEEELFPGPGVELAVQAMVHARASGNPLMIVCNSALTDMAELLAHPRWEECSRGVVGGVVLMGGVTPPTERGVELDKTAQNNSFDLPSANKVFDYLCGHKEISLVVVTRHSASACQLPRTAFDGSPHPLAVRLTTVSKPSLQKLWERTQRSKEEREAVKDALPMRCDAAWFRGTFLEATAPAGLTGADDIWPFVKGFNEYDGMATVAAATLKSPELFSTFFAPYTDPKTGVIVIGISPAEPGVQDASKGSELLHDLMVNALDLRKPGQGILYRPDGAGGAWRSMLLSRPLRQKGPDCWLAEPVVTRCDLGGAVVGCLAGRSKKNGEVEIYLSDATKDEMWRLV